MDDLHAVHELVPLFLTVGREHGDLGRQVQLVFHTHCLLVVFPGAQPFFQAVVFFVVPVQLLLEGRSLLFHFLLPALEVGKFLFLIGQAVQFFFRFFQIGGQLVDFPLSPGAS